MDKESPLIRFFLKAGILQSLPDDFTLELEGHGPIVALQRMGLLRESEAIRILSERLGIEHVDLISEDEAKTLRVDDFKDKVDGAFCRQYLVCPLKRTNKGVMTAFANPLDHEALKAVEFALSSPVSMVIAEESKILRIINKYFPDVQDIFEEDNPGDYIDIEVIKGGRGTEDEETSETKNVAPIVRLVNEILVDAIKAEASDIHIEPARTVVDIRFRIDGVMQKVLEVPKKLHSYLVARIKVLAAMDVSEKRRPQDGRLGVRMGDHTIDMRVSSIPTSNGEKIVLRIMRSDYEGVTFKTLGFPPHIEEAFGRALESHSKLVLVTGPTGSGKTTTLYTAINSIKDGKKNITTVEDPIEYKFEGINQIQLNKAIDVTFGSALRSILRQDPDVIMIGEIRDTETLNIALQAALTGHLVLSTLHTNDAPNAVTRILNMGADPFIVGSTLAGVLAQRLVRKICSHCSVPPTEKDIMIYRKYMDAYGIEPDNLRKAFGCDYCFQTGYKGRLGVYSYLEITEEIAHLISTQASIEDIILAARRTGYDSLDTAVADLWRHGVTTFEEVKGYLSLEAKSRYKAKQSSPTPPPQARPPQQPIVQTPPKPQVAPLRSHQNNRISAGPPRPPVPPQVKVRPPSPPRFAKKDTKRTKILVVEDDIQARGMLRSLLEGESYEVVEASNGEEGLNLVRSHAPQLILCDLEMPVMDGRAFLQKMKSDAKTMGIPIIMMTRGDDKESGKTLLKLGAQDCVSKDSAPNGILQKIRRVVNCFVD
ncbi:MAG: type II/IV secretion system protein [Candidatus Dadabacteria bacterium]|nr:MAG: type II/IV secretion system protein [Candidatus Dadabacteria bacterium]